MKRLAPSGPSCCLRPDRPDAAAAACMAAAVAAADSADWVGAITP